MKNFIRLLQLVQPSKAKGFRLNVSSGFNGLNVYMFGNEPVNELDKPLFEYYDITDDELEPVILEALDHLAGKVPTEGVHGCVTADNRIFSVTEQEDYYYIWSSEEIGEQLKDEIHSEIVDKFKEQQND